MRDGAKDGSIDYPRERRDARSLARSAPLLSAGKFSPWPWDGVTAFDREDAARTDEKINRTERESKINRSFGIDRENCGRFTQRA